MGVQVEIRKSLRVQMQITKNKGEIEKFIYLFIYFYDI